MSAAKIYKYYDCVFIMGMKMFKSREEALKSSKGIMGMITKEPPFSQDSRINRLGRRFVMVSTEYFVIGLMHDIMEFAGEEAAAVILYRGGFNSGRMIFERYHSLVNDRDMALEMCAASAWYFGWGIATIYHEEVNGEIIGHARIYDSFEAEEYMKMEDFFPERKCHFIRGVVAGIMSEYTGRIYEAEETKCKAAGYDYCEFVIRPKKDERSIPSI